MRVSRYTPSLLDPKDLETIFVQRHKLAEQLVEVVRESVLTASKHYTLLIGPRGIGKTHLVSLLYHRVTQQDDLQERLVIAWLREEEWGISSFFDLVLRILNALQKEYKDEHLSSVISSLYGLSPQDAEAVALSALTTFIGQRTLLLLIENLDEVFKGIDHIGQKQLRSFLQEQGCCTIVATSQSLFNGVKLQTSPFYGFFRIRYLKDFSVDEAVSLLAKIAQLEENSELVRFLRSPKGRSRVQAVHHLAGGNPRIYVIFSEFLTHESLDELVQPFMNMLDDLTPYYQARMMYLSHQQRKIIEVLSRRKHPIPVKEIAQQCFVTHQTVSSQLKDLRDKGYVLADSVGRQSFYELREPLMRICLSVKETRGEPVRLIVDFLKSWYPRQELQLMQHHFFDRLDLGQEHSVKASRNRKSIGKHRLADYVRLALDDSEVELDPRITTCVRELCQQYNQQNFDVALSFAQKLVILRGIAEDVCVQGNILRYLGRYEEAISSYDQAIQLKPDYHEAFFLRGISLANLGLYKEAISSYDQAIQLKPDYHEAFFLRGNALDDLDLYEEAISSYDQAIQLKPDYHEAFFLRGNALDDLDLYEEAISSYDQAIQLKADFHEAFGNRGIALANLDLYEKAISSYDQAIQFKPDDHDTFFNKGISLANLGLYEEAISSYDQAIQLKPDFHEAFGKRGISLANLGLYEEAIASYDHVIQLKSDDHLAFFHRGNALANLGLYEEAIASYDHVIQLKSDDHLAFFNKGISLANLGLYEEAISSYDQAIQLKPDFHEAFGNRGISLDDLGLYEEAISSYDQAIQLKPDFHEAFGNRGVSLANLGRYKEAIVSYDEALAINPNTPYGALNRAEAVFALTSSKEAYTAIIDTLKRLTESEKNGGWQADIMLLSLFKQTQDPKQWQSHIKKLASLFEQYQFLNALGAGLVKNCSALLSEMVSQAAAQAWLEIWTEEASEHEEFMIPLRLLKVTVLYKQKPDDPRVFLELPTEERLILKQALGLES